MQNLLAGLLLIVIAGIAVWQGGALPMGSLRHIGPGMFPMVLAGFIALVGVALVATWARGERRGTGRWPMRGPLFILGSAVIFGLAVRPLGLAVAGPLLVVVAAFASDETRWIEIILFAAGMTVFCLVLFKYLLSLPIPVAPWLIGY